MRPRAARSSSRSCAQRSARRCLKSLSLARHGADDHEPARARASLEEIRRAGVCVTADDLVPGASGIAAPVFDRYGRVAGACAIGGPTERVRPRLPTARHRGDGDRAGLSARLGYRPGQAKDLAQGCADALGDDSERHRYWARLSASRCEAPARARPGPRPARLRRAGCRRVTVSGSGVTGTATSRRTMRSSRPPCRR